MSNSDSFHCIKPNPDISGIGVRVAIYAQALLSIIYPIIFAWDGKISLNESRTMSRVSINITVTACALLISTGIQAATFGVSLYHALIILQLSWINSMTFMTIFFVRQASHSLNIDIQETLATLPSEQLQMTFLQKQYLAGPRLVMSREALIGSVHFIVVGGIGIWVWNGIQTFGSQPECNDNTFIIILSRMVYGELPICIVH
jgi:hypothetical protein